MAVYTQVSRADAAALVQLLDLGELQSLQGIEGGIENTNYFLDTSRGRWVLTLFERLTHAQLPFYLHLMKHLAARGIPVPEPQNKPAHAPVGPDEDELLHTLCGKPATVVNRLQGRSELAPTEHHCATVGDMLAHAHLAACDFHWQQPNLRGLPWWNETAPVVLPYLDGAQAALLTRELNLQNKLSETRAYAQLPRGAVHADLFRDNVMFVGQGEAARLTGFFDFYFAGVDTWLFDLAVSLNDWTIDLDSGQTDEARAQAFLQAYQNVRVLTADEQALLPDMLRAAALRFWISRLWDFYRPRPAQMLKPHDPKHFERILRARAEQKEHLLA